MFLIENFIDNIVVAKFISLLLIYLEKSIMIEETLPSFIRSSHFTFFTFFKGKPEKNDESSPKSVNNLLTSNLNVSLSFEYLLLEINLLSFKVLVFSTSSVSISFIRV